MGKIDENRQQKLEALYSSAYDLFIDQGIEKTSISDITKMAGVAKGTFYLYFKDKYELRDHLIARTAEQLFLSAWEALDFSSATTFEDRLIFIVDYILEQMTLNKPMLRFISKNLSWGIFRRALLEKDDTTQIPVVELFRKLVLDNPSIKLKEPQIMIFMIIDLASSTSFSTILENEPISFEELKPYLNEAIRAIIKAHTIE